jgi:hypothetical protein
VAELLGVIEGLGTIYSKVRPGVLIGLAGNRKGRIEVSENLDCVIGGTGVRHADGIGDFKGSLNGSANDSRFVLNH